ncbi:hypothetical protein IO348_000571 [Campylobacter jejuni]|uniref:hypothetical protein n=1 Tax=Campylobacter TaxID=194 RepID=UPI000875A853|nr:MULTISPECIES: hypothetical protein [Campylobacter]EDP8137420.1 hypothetical protein [Campylobacter jejuni]EGK7546004.1 hypothetical protein [Campylobacter jejuni]EHD9160213.1 hypothetical protein [Campylobacter jejuni]OEW26700.1 hypothetical protein AJ877_07975 [Campylobacter jejuni]OEW65360.1 hypothetical protein AJN58_08855 [Campylobacter sp. BCW_4321]
MKKVVFKCCLSGNIFYKKGDEVLLKDSEALRLLEKGIVEIVEQEEQKQNTDEKSNTDKKPQEDQEMQEKPQEDQEMQEKPQKQNEKEDKKGKK